MGNCIGGIMSNVIYFSEKFAMFLSFTCLISCSIVCMICMLAFGIGLGYNYSYVDFKTKHTYVAGAYKKTRPTNYLGPGHFKPTTKNSGHKNELKRRWHSHRVRTQSEVQEPEIFEVVHESPDDLPHRSPIEELPAYVKDRPSDPFFGNNLQDLYFSKDQDERRLNGTVVPQNESTTNMPIYNSGNNSKYKFNITDQASIAFNNSEVNATSNLEPIVVNVTKTHDKSAPFVLNTKMYQNQLVKWLSRLQRANKTFAVYVTTN
ncbi:uncharacterized protein [Choristoneura fumiferana]|uniref:uncharacterized protein n=1 Tax=Choristoneura fumiferana TaxID=7141 RepID=UPI003D157678